MKNDIGFGIMCFGDDYYYQGAIEKVKNIVKQGFQCCILTDDATNLMGIHDYYYNVHYLEYDREFKSYHDKMMIAKEILKFHNICILIDADAHITDYSFLNVLKRHKFKEGISYVDVLYNHPEKKEFVKEIDMSRHEWKYYHDYAKSILPDFGELELMWEYFLVVNSNGSDLRKFYQIYERLQVAKEFGELKSNEVVGCGEGISIAVASKLSGTPCERDYDLYKSLEGKISNISRRFTRDDNK